MKDWLRLRIKEIINSGWWKAAGDWARGRERVPPAGHELNNIAIPATVVAYFGDPAEKVYQLQPWLQVLERLDESYPVLLVFRKLTALRAIRRESDLRKVFVRRFEDLMSLYESSEATVALYVNNGVTNFQSLSAGRLVHVHLNHGESDKISMVSNQAKAYDRVFVAGDAAVERHRKALIGFDESKLVKVGRPQLDLVVPTRRQRLAGAVSTTVMYAPTWEGENEANNYTSLDCYGPEIIRQLLELPDVRVLYKPHPRVADSDDAGVLEAHRNIARQLEEAERIRRCGHRVLMSGDILRMFADVDVLISDVSSVGLDFLYLYPERPLVLTDRRSKRDDLERDAPVAGSCAVIDAHNACDVRGLVSGLLDRDPYVEKRRATRSYYFGDRGRGEATEAFIREIGALIEERTRLLRSHDVPSGAMEAEDEA